MGSILYVGSPQPFTPGKAEDPKQLSAVTRETASCGRGIKPGVPQLWLSVTLPQRGSFQDGLELGEDLWMLTAIYQITTYDTDTTRAKGETKMMIASADR